MLGLARFFRSNKAVISAPQTTVSEAAAILAKAAKYKARQPIRDQANQMRASMGLPPIDWKNL